MQKSDMEHKPAFSVGSASASASTVADSSNLVFEYEAKLLGILQGDRIPQNASVESTNQLHPNGSGNQDEITNCKTSNGGPLSWDCKDIHVIQKPSAMKLEGPVQLNDQPPLKNSAVVERKVNVPWEKNLNVFHISEALNKNPNKVDSSKGEDDDGTMEVDQNQQKPPSGRCELSVESFLQKYFNPKTAEIPNFILQRVVLLYLCTNEFDSVFQVRKLKFISEIDGIERSTIEIKTHCSSIPFTFLQNGWKDLDPAWMASIKRKNLNSKDGLTEENKNRKFDDCCYTFHKDTSKKYITKYTGFVQGTLSCHQKSNDGKKTEKLVIDISTDIQGGLWKYEENPANYTSADVAEIKRVKKPSVEHYFRPFEVEKNDRRTDSGVGMGLDTGYMNLRMRRNWVSGHFIGAKYFLNCTGPNRKATTEFWLFDLDKLPMDVQLAGQIQRVEPWTPPQIHQELFKSLQNIQAAVNRVKTDDADQTFYFIKYARSNNVVHDKDGKLLDLFEETKRTVVFSGFSTNFRSGSKNEGGGAEGKAFWQKVRKFVSYPNGFDMPKITGVHQGIEFTFSTIALATAFYDVFKSCMRTNKGNQPDCLKLITFSKKLIRPPSSSWRSYKDQANKRRCNQQQWKRRCIDNKKPVNLPEQRPPSRSSNVSLSEISFNSSNIDIYQHPWRDSSSSSSRRSSWVDAPQGLRAEEVASKLLSDSSFNSAPDRRKSNRRKSWCSTSKDMSYLDRNWRT